MHPQAVPSYRTSPHFGWYSFTVPQRVGDWVGLSSWLVVSRPDGMTLLLCWKPLAVMLCYANYFDKLCVWLSETLLSVTMAALKACELWRPVEKMKQLMKSTISSQLSMLLLTVWPVATSELQVRVMPKKTKKSYQSDAKKCHVFFACSWPGTTVVDTPLERYGM